MPNSAVTTLSSASRTCVNDAILERPSLRVPTLRRAGKDHVIGDNLAPRHRHQLGQNVGVSQRREGHHPGVEALLPERQPGQVEGSAVTDHLLAPGRIECLEAAAEVAAEGEGVAVHSEPPWLRVAHRWREACEVDGSGKVG